MFHAPAIGTGGCTVERELGAEALPYSCRQFPRLLLVDSRGWHQSLSAWCGTAARMLVTGAQAPDSVGGHSTDFFAFDHVSADARVHLESLDARDAWPPLLKPGVLAGHEVYGLWESRLIDDFLGASTTHDAPVAFGLTRLLCWSDALRAWRPSDGSLEVLARRPWRLTEPQRLLRHAADGAMLKRLVETLVGRVPPEWRPPAWPNGLTDARADGPVVSRAVADAALARYLAARLMASWVAYQGRGLRSTAASLVSAYVLAAMALQATSPSDGPQVVCLGRLTSAIRASDWLLLHLLDREVWAAWCAEWESAPDVRPLLALVAGATRVLDSLDWASSTD